MSSLDDWPLLKRALIDTNKEDSDEKTKIFIDTWAFIIDKIVENVNHICHQYQFTSSNIDVEDDGLSEITKSRSKTMTYKSEPPRLQNQI